MKPKNKTVIRSEVKTKKDNSNNISKHNITEKEGFVPYTNRLPDTITLPDGRIFTNQDIVSIKRKRKDAFDIENDLLLEEIEIAIAKLNTEPQSLIRRLSNKPNKTRVSGIVSKKD